MIIKMNPDHDLNKLRSSKKVWTKEEDRILVLMFERGCTLDEMKSVFKGRTVDAIRRRLNSLGYKAVSRVPNDIDYDVLRKILGDDFDKI